MSTTVALVAALLPALALADTAPVQSGGEGPHAGGVATGDREPVRPPSRVNGSTMARILAPTFARRAPGSSRHGRRLRVLTAWSAQPQRLLALDERTRDGRAWVKLLLGSRPNGSAGWVPREKVVLSRTRYWVEVRTRARRVTIYHGGRRVRRFRAVVGASQTPTPHGLAAIYERNRQPDPRAFLGPWALSLTAFSDVLENFGGGPGRVAIHGRAGASLRDPLGSARSHGCIRIPNRAISWMARRLPAGTPVRLRR